MTERVSEHPAAGAELLEAAEFYEDLVPGLGHEFMTRIANGVRSIAENPASWPPVLAPHGGTTVRSRAIHSFPYRVVYMLLGTDVIILSYAHARQRPGYWRDRAEEFTDG